jgi:4-amino-4-deoxy-L-arabinose transferase-like glycosyltransferase
MFATIKRLNSTRLVYALTLLGAALRFYRLGHFSLWDGEIFTLFISQKALPLIIPALRDFGAHPPMWFFVTRAFDTFGWNEWMLRAPSALVGILAIPALYLVGKRAGNATVGLIAALLLACAPLAVLYAQVGRMYSIILPLTALMLYAMTRALQTKQWRWWLALSVFSALIVYNQYLSLLAVASAYLTAGLILLAQTLTHSPLRGEEGGVKPISPCLVGEGAGVRSLLRDFFKRTARLWGSFGAFWLLLAPLLPLMAKNFFQRQLGREALAASSPVTVNFDFLRALFLDLAGNEWLLLLSGIFIAAGLLLSLRRRDLRSLLLAVTWFGIVFVVVMVIHPRRFPSRYVLHLLPVYILLTAHGIFLTGEWLGHRVTRMNAMRSARAFMGVATAALVVLAAFELAGTYRGTQEISRGERTTALLLNGGWRELAQYLEQHVAPGDIVVYGGDGPVRPPRFIAPYVSSAYQIRAHTVNASGNALTNIWWVGVNLGKDDIVTPTATRVDAPLSFGDTAIVHGARAVTWETLPLPRALNAWKIQTDKPGITFTETADAFALRADYTAPANARMVGPTVAVRPGQLFRLTARVRGVSEGFYDFSPALNLQFFDAKQQNVSDTGAQTLLPADANGWRTLVLDGVVPPQATSARPVLEWSDYSFWYAPHIELSDLQWQVERVSE